MYLRLHIVLILLATAHIAHGYRFRQKRFSDQRLAELETLVGISKLKGNLKKIPYGYGARDPNKLGRRRRASAGVLINRILDQIEREEPYLSENLI